MSCDVCGVDPTRQVHLLAAHEAAVTAPDVDITDEAVRALLASLLSEDVFPDFAYEPETCPPALLDEIDASNRAAASRALAAAVPLLRKAWEQELREQIAEEIGRVATGGATRDYWRSPQEIKADAAAIARASSEAS